MDSTLVYQCSKIIWKNKIYISQCHLWKSVVKSAYAPFHWNEEKLEDIVLDYIRKLKSSETENEFWVMPGLRKRKNILAQSQKEAALLFILVRKHYSTEKNFRLRKIFNCWLQEHVFVPFSKPLYTWIDRIMKDLIESQQHYSFRFMDTDDNDYFTFEHINNLLTSKRHVNNKYYLTE